MATHARSEFVVVASHDGRIQAFDAHDGRMRWTQTRGHPFTGLALVQVGHEVIAVSGDGYVCVLALDDGQVRWETSLPIASPVTSPSGGIRIAANQQLVAVQLGSIVFALALADGHVSWKVRPAPSAYLWRLLAAGEEHIYTMQTELSPARPHLQQTPIRSRPDEQRNLPRLSIVTTAFSSWDGTPHWFAHEGDSAVEPPWDGGSSLVEKDGVVYVCAGQGLHAFQAESGALLWSCDIESYFHIGAVAVGRSSVAVAAGRHLGVYRRDTGALLWSELAANDADGYFEEFDTPLILGGTVYVGRSMAGGSHSPKFRMESHEGETGALRWTWPTAAPAASEVVRSNISWRFRGAGDTLYIPSLDDIWAIQARDGSERWHLGYDFRSGRNALLAVAIASS